MVIKSKVVYQCNICCAEWAIEPEPHYRTWEEMGHDNPIEIEEDFVVCPFCGSESVAKVD